MSDDTPPAQWNGVPPGPEKGGWHWLQLKGEVELECGYYIKNYLTVGNSVWWFFLGTEASSLPDIAANYSYLGPCLTPAEVAERERAAAEPLLAAAQFVLAEGMLGAHSAHWDRQGTHGANCPACKANGEAQQRLQDAVSAELARRRERQQIAQEAACSERTLEGYVDSMEQALAQRRQET